MTVAPSPTRSFSSAAEFSDADTLENVKLPPGAEGPAITCRASATTRTSACAQAGSFGRAFLIAASSRAAAASSDEKGVAPRSTSRLSLDEPSAFGENAIEMREPAAGVAIGKPLIAPPTVPEAAGRFGPNASTVTRAEPELTIVSTNRGLALAVERSRKISCRATIVRPFEIPTSEMTRLKSVDGSLVA